MLSQLVGVSVLLCTYNGMAQITKTLRCLAYQQMEAGVFWEVILVDNASSDETAEIARQVWRTFSADIPLYIINEPRPGKQYALQAAVSKAKYCYTCIVDDDNRLPYDYLCTGFKILESNMQIGILGGPNTATFDTKEPDWFTSFQHCYAVGSQLDRMNGSHMPLSDGNIGRNVLWGAGMFVRTSLWIELRKADFQSLFTGRELNKQLKTNLTGGEDDELCYAAQLLGYEVWYSTQLHLQHHMSTTRLDESYRDQLFYDSARTTGRLNAYRNALWGKSDAPLYMNLFKDSGYLVLSFIKKLIAFSSAKVNGSMYILNMEKKHARIAVENVLFNFRQVKKYYKQVNKLKERISILISIHS